MILLVITVHVFLFLVFVITLFNVFTAPLLLHYPELIKTPKVSVLVPARNEENTILQCLQGLIEQNYPDYEIIVLDDQSTDNTCEIVQELQDKYPIKLIKGKDLPAGWTGKNWACNQLYRASSGDILIYTDADNIYKPDAVRATVAWIHKYDLGLLSAFPQQITSSLAEKLIVPVVDMWVYSMLPLWLTRFSKHPSLAAANGQWLAFTREAYEKTDGHSAVRNKIVEDTGLARLSKKNQIHILTLAGRGIVFGNMYNGWDQVYKGFSKNLFGLMGYHTFGFLFFLFFMFLVFVLPFLLVWIWPGLWMSSVLINLLIRLLMVFKYGHPFAVSLFLHPVAIILFIVVGINSLKSFLNGNIVWKERNIVFEK